MRKLRLNPKRPEGRDIPPKEFCRDCDEYRVLAIMYSGKPPNPTAAQVVSNTKYMGASQALTKKEARSIAAEFRNEGWDEVRIYYANEEGIIFSSESDDPEDDYDGWMEAWVKE